MVTILSWIPHHPLSYPPLVRVFLHSHQSILNCWGHRSLRAPRLSQHHPPSPPFFKKITCLLRQSAHQSPPFPEGRTESESDGVLEGATDTQIPAPEDLGPTLEAGREGSGVAAPTKYKRSTISPQNPDSTDFYLSHTGNVSQDFHKAYRKTNALLRRAKTIDNFLKRRFPEEKWEEEDVKTVAARNYTLQREDYRKKNGKRKMSRQ